MAIETKLDAAWEVKEAKDAVFAFRAAIENLNAVVDETSVKFTEILHAGSFATVDAEIIAEGQALITIVEQMQSALAGHSDFINWRQ